MKKRILGVAFGAALLVGGFALNTQNAEAKMAPVAGKTCQSNGANIKMCSRYGFNMICEGSGRDCRYTRSY